jgi:hypothetical protein
MFIRIKKRQLVPRGDNGPNDFSIRVMIVESYRQDGQPRQRVVKYLGSIRKSELRDMNTRKDFVLRLQHKLEDPELDLTYRERTALKLNIVQCLYHRLPILGGHYGRHYGKPEP